MLAQLVHFPSSCRSRAGTFGRITSEPVAKTGRYAPDDDETFFHFSISSGEFFSIKAHFCCFIKFPFAMGVS